MQTALAPLVFLAAVSSCLPVSSGNPAAGGAVGNWASSVLGTSRYAVEAERPAAGADPAWWSNGTDHFPATLEYAFFHASQVDNYGMVAVLHDVPAWLDPLRPMPPDRSPGLVAVPSSSGRVRIYRSTSPFFAVHLVVMPPSTWFIVTDLAVESRLIGSLDAHPFVPYANLHRGSVGDTYKPDDHERDAPWVPERDHKIGSGYVFYPPQPGGLVPVVLKLVYDDPAAASRATADLRGSLQSGALRQVLGPPLLQHVAGVTQEGASAFVQTYLSRDDARELARNQFF